MRLTLSRVNTSSSVCVVQGRAPGPRPGLQRQELADGGAVPAGAVPPAGHAPLLHLLLPLPAVPVHSDLATMQKILRTTRNLLKQSCVIVSQKHVTLEHI